MSTYEKRKFSIISSLFAVVITVLSVLIMVFGFTSSAIKSSSKYNDKISIFEKTSFDYGVYDPSLHQIDEMLSNQFINDVFEYYQYDCELSFNNKSYSSKTIFSNNSSALKISSYTESRLLDGVYSISENDIFIDEIVAKALNVKVNDQILLSFKSVQNLQFKVKGIFETNTILDNGSVFFLYKGNVKTTIDSQIKTRLYGALIDAKDNQNCYQYLKESYVPYGRMLSRDYFDSDKEYNTYVEKFINDDYTSEIYNKQASYDATKTNYSYLIKETTFKILIGSVISNAIMLLLCFIPIIGAKYETSYEKRTKTAISNSSYRKTINSIDIISFLSSNVLVLAISTLILGQKNLSNGIIKQLALFYSIASIISLSITMVTSNFAINKINNKKY